MSTPQQYEIDLERVANEPISEGIHAFVVKSIEEKESGAGNPMWVVQLACLDEVDGGKQVPLFLVLTPNARWKFELFLDAVGAPRKGKAVAEQFINQRLRAQILHEDYEGSLRAKVGELYPMSTNPASVQAPASFQGAKAVTAPKRNVPVSAPAKAPAKSVPVKGKPTTRLPADVRKR